MKVWIAELPLEAMCNELEADPELLGIFYTEKEAREAVEAWKEANPKTLRYEKPDVFSVVVGERLF